MKNRLHIIRYDELDSTNSEAARHLSDIDNMSVLSAKRQYAGRGKDSNVSSQASKYSEYNKATATYNVGFEFLNLYRWNRFDF